MRNLIAFLLRYHFFLLFLLLELMSFLLIKNNNGYQQSVIFGVTNDVTGSIQSVVADINSYFILRDENTRLTIENAKFRNLQKSSYLESDLMVQFVNDTLYRQRYSYIPAKIVSNSTSRHNNYLVIDKGSKHGLDFDMAVLTSAGVVGIVKDVSSHFSSVISLLNTQIKISGKIKNNGYVGTIIWQGKNYREGQMLDVPIHVKLNKGDTIITSGYSLIFPEGIPMGTITDYSIGSGDNFYAIEVDFTTDFKKVHHVYVVKDLLKNEIMELDMEEEE